MSEHGSSNGSASSRQRLAARPVWRELDLDALGSNLAEARRRAGPGTRLIASIKADAYGHGVVAVARRLSELGVEMLATGSFADAVAVREAGITTRIEMFAGALPEAMGEYLAHGLTPTLHSMALAQAASRAATGPTNVHIKVDCGLGRIGVPYDDAPAFVDTVARLPNLVIEAIYTHLPFAGAQGRDWAISRIARFEDLLERLDEAGHRPAITEAIASAGLQLRVSSRATTVCPGHLLYGVTTGQAGFADDTGLKPVLRMVRARLIHTLRYDRAVQIGSSGALHKPAGTIVGTIPIGLADGLRPAAPGRSLSAILRGRAVPVMGVSMEHSTLDLTGVDTPAVGEVVTLLGSDGDAHITLRDLADAQGTSQTAVLMNFAGRLADGP